MQELTFETILRLPQMELKKRLKAELKSRGYHITDKPGYLYAPGIAAVTAGTSKSGTRAAFPRCMHT